MKKIVLVSIIFSLILLTAIIKNTAKQIEDELFTTKENLRILKPNIPLRVQFRLLQKKE